MSASHMTAAIIRIKNETKVNALTAAQIDSLYNESAAFDFVDSLNLNDDARADVCAFLVDYFHGY